MNIKVLIIDDEQPARDIIKLFLHDHENVKLLGQCKNGFDGMKMIAELKPDLIFLDIQMPKIDGFEMLELIEEPPAVIFCTAYDEYAIKAFEYKAVDYILKPFTKQRFDEAMKKAKAGITKELPKRNELMELSEIYHHKLERIAIKTGDKIDIISVDAIHYLEAQDDYVEIHAYGKTYLKQQTMNYYERALKPEKFVRIHRRFIVHITEIARLEKYGKETWVAILKNNDRLTVSASGYVKLKNVLDI